MSMTMRAASALVRTLNRPAVRGVLANSISRSMASLSGGQAVAQLAKELPHKDAVRYEHKNQKFAFKDVDFHAESLACGFVEQGFRPGDIVLSWLPDHFSEQVSE
jgi:acyl-CoA synthetase (AMP-forming)/AMP-acid ligase II